MGTVVIDLARIAGTVGAALLLGCGIEAVDSVVGGCALGEASATGFSTGVALATDGLLGLISASIAANKTHAEDRHRGQAVGLGLSTGVDGTGQESNGSSNTDEHFDCCSEL